MAGDKLTITPFAGKKPGT